LTGLLEQSNTEDKELCGIFYDQSKAFDRIQWWHIENMCDRFALPTSFRNFVISYLKSSTTHIKSAYGLTKPVKLRNSVKQGDPLAGYIYICCMDALHSHLGNLSDKHGVQITPETTISSIGYADDTLILSHCLLSLHISHVFVVEFFKSHTLRLNISKTVAFSRCIPQILQNKFEFKINNSVIKFNTKKVFRYLGILYTPNLDWEEHLKNIERTRIFPIWRRICTGKFSITQIRYIYLDLVISVIDFSSRFFVIPKHFLERWDTLLYRSIIKAIGSLYPSLSRDGLYSVIGIRTLADCSLTASVSETMLILNSKSLEGKFFRQLFAKNLLPDGYYCSLPCRRNTHETNFNRMLKLLKKQDISLQMNYQSSELGIHKGYMCGSAGTLKNFDPCAKTVDVFTDGSTDPSDPSAISGYAAVIVTNKNLKDPQVLQGTIYADGNNYLAEAAAIICALETIPSFLNIRLYTDALSFLSATITFEEKTHREKIRTSARSFLRRFHELCNDRQGSVRMQHVRSHSNCKDYFSRGNNVADIECNKARLSSLVPDFTPEVGEHIYTIRIKNQLVLNDYRGEIKTFQEKRMLERWTKQKYQGQIAKTHGKLLLNTLNKFRLTSYAIQMATGTIPTGRLLHHLPRFKDMIICPFCDCFVSDTNTHCFNCPKSIQLLQNNPPPLNNSVKILISTQVNLIFDTLDNTFASNSALSLSQHKAIVRMYVSRCIVQNVCISRKQFLSATQSLEFRKHKSTLNPKVFQALATCFNCTSLLSGGYPVFWKHCRRWYLMGEKIPQILGGWSDVTELLGASTIIDIFVDSYFFCKLTNLLSMAHKTSYPTRIVFQSQIGSLDFPGVVCLTKASNQNVFTYIFHNDQGSKAFPIEKNMFLQTFKKQPEFSCSGDFDLPDPETEFRLRALLIPFGWIKNWNLLQYLGEFTLYDLLIQYSNREPLDISICSEILGITKPSPTDLSQISMRQDFAKYATWIRNFGKQVFCLRRKLWNSFPK